ncbi:hypothetical protein Hanom_Chr04g00367291 [Helianthus anomalus]
MNEKGEPFPSLCVSFSTGTSEDSDFKITILPVSFNGILSCDLFLLLKNFRCLRATGCSSGP